MRVLPPLSLGVFLLAALALAGCDGIPMGQVKGTVKYNGKLIEDGWIRFEPADGKTQPAADKIKDGEYSLKVPVGNMKVIVSSSKVVGKKKLYANDPNSPEQDLTEEVLPEKYSDMMKTELRFEVKPGLNPKDWDLAK